MFQTIFPKRQVHFGERQLSFFEKKNYIFLCHISINQGKVFQKCFLIHH